MEQGMGSVVDIIAVGCLPMVLKAAIELRVLGILGNAGPSAMLSAGEIASQLPTKNPNAGITLNRLLHLLASYSILSRAIGPNGERRYGLTPMCMDLIPDQDGISQEGSILITCEKAMMAGWYYLKDAVLEGSVPFTKAHGMSSFEFCGKDAKLSKTFSNSMYNMSMKVMRAVLENYRGFEVLEEIVDVGGGIGASLRMIISKYPRIKGVNFDLPYVVSDAPSHPGMKHVGGDMFESVPNGDAIFMKTVLHDWDDERCIKILKNCWKALPDFGKVIAVEYILPEDPTTDPISRQIIGYDLWMLAVTEGGKERTTEEFEALAKISGFSAIKTFLLSNGIAVMEFYKNS